MRLWIVRAEPALPLLFQVLATYPHASVAEVKAVGHLGGLVSEFRGVQKAGSHSTS